MKQSFRILVLNLGSTSSKIAVYRGEQPEFTRIRRHSPEEMASIHNNEEDYCFRREWVLRELEQEKIPLDSLDAVVGRGGYIKSMAGGTYEVNALMCEELRSEKWGFHTANLASRLAFELGQRVGKPAYIVDPVVVDELEPLARVTGCPGIERRAAWHALNQRAVARNYARKVGRTYQDMNLIVAHLGGGITIGAHRKGRTIDVNNGMDGDGPLSANRAGELPWGQVLERYCSGNYADRKALHDELTFRSGLKGHLGTDDGREIVRRIEGGDEKAELIYKAMAYQIAKLIGALATVLSGEVDAILLTGGFAYDPLLTGWISQRVDFIAPVVLEPGENEMDALAFGALRVLRGEETAIQYTY